MIDPLDLHALVDGQTTSEQRDALMKEMAQSETCAAQFRAISLLKECVQTKAEQYDCDASWKKCVSRLDEIDKANRVNGFVGKYAWAMCAIFFVVILGGGYLNRLAGHNLATPDISRYSSVLHMGGTHSQESVAVTERVNQVLKSARTAAPEQIKIVGVNDCVIEDRRVVCVFLQDNPNVQPVRLMVIPNVESIDGTQLDLGTYYPGRVNRMDSVIWRDGSDAMVLMGNRTPDELNAIAKNLTVRR